MKPLHKYAGAALLALSTLAGCKQSNNHSIRMFADVDSAINACRVAVGNSHLFTPEERKITCMKYLTGKMDKGGITLQQNIPCEEITSKTRLEVTELIGGKKCFAPNVSGWPNRNLGPEHSP